MATRDQMSDAIAPGSTEYGDRQAIAANLPTAGGGSPTPQGRSARPAPQNLASPGGSGGLARLLEGKATKGGAPLTERLSLGPGSGPVETAPAGDPVIERLRYLASASSSPRLRMLARQSLRRRVQGAS